MEFTRLLDGFAFPAGSVSTMIDYRRQSTALGILRPPKDADVYNVAISPTGLYDEDHPLHQNSGFTCRMIK